MSNEKTRKLNPLQAFFLKRKMMKKKRKFFKASINPNEYKPFLEEIQKTLEKLMRDVPDKGLFLDRMGQESAKWLNDMPEMNLASFKAGVCFGAFLLAKKGHEQSKKESYVV